MNIAFSLSLAPNYKNNFVDIKKTDYEINFDLQDGAHTVTTPVMNVGNLLYLENRSLNAQLTFTYEYDAANKTVTIDGPDFSSPNSMRLATFPEGMNEITYQRASDSSIERNDVLFNPNWNYNTPMTPNLNVAFTGIVKTALDNLIQALKNREGLVLQVRTPPPKLSPEEHANLLLVYVNNQFQGLYDPTKDYGTNFTVTPIESVWGGTVHFNYGENFANVIGSTSDPKIAGNSWIRLWENQFGPATICTSYQYQGFNCNNNYLVGGHIILGQQALQVPAGSNSVYIMPICVAHNNNDNVYMAALQYLDGIWLINYMH